MKSKKPTLKCQQKSNIVSLRFLQLGKAQPGFAASLMPAGHINNSIYALFIHSRVANFPWPLPGSMGQARPAHFGAGWDGTGQPPKQRGEQRSCPCHFGKARMGSRGGCLPRLPWSCSHQGLSLWPGEERGLQQGMGVPARGCVAVPAIAPSRAVQMASKGGLEGERGVRGCLLLHTPQESNGQSSQRHSSHSNECCSLSK